MKRKAAVAGRFYPSDAESLRRDLKSYIPKAKKKSRAIGIISPHAGFVYSGDVAGSVYSSIEIPETVVLLGPNHSGRGPVASTMANGVWVTPLGEIEIDRSFAHAILEASKLLKADVLAHQYEHSLETQIPFIQHFRKNFKIVPICLQRISLETCQELSRSILTGLKKLDRSILIVASSDMTHYESHETVSQKDKMAIDQILKLDPEGLFRTVCENQITMCGVMPVMVMLMTANQLGAKKAELIKYMTSGIVSGDMQHVVGYAGIVVQ